MAVVGINYTEGKQKRYKNLEYKGVYIHYGNNKKKSLIRVILLLTGIIPINLLHKN